MQRRLSGHPTGHARLVSLFGMIWAALGAHAAEIHVAVGGDDGNAGDAGAPLASPARAIERAAAGDTVWVHGGYYEAQRRIRLRQSGTETAPIRIRAVPGKDRPVLDFAGERGEGLRIEGAWWRLEGLTVMKAGRQGISIAGEGAHHITLEGMVARANGGTGINVSRGAHHNLVLNCDSYQNFDPENHGQNADGFGAKFDIGPGNRFVGCRAWNNSDDGYDTWHSGGAVRFEHCFAWANGVNLWEDREFEGNGNGFKLGQREGAHEVVRCAAWDQPKRGFDLNGNSTGVRVEHCTAFRCERNFAFMNAQGNAEKNVLRNNLSYEGKVEIDPAMDDAHNSWSIEGVTIGTEDFESLDPKALEGPRGEDYALPTGAFPRLAAGSDAIDAGVDLGEPYQGKAPDLGAFERE
jgi:hypothetical protein